MMQLMLLCQDTSGTKVNTHIRNASSHASVPRLLFFLFFTRELSLRPQIHTPQPFFVFLQTCFNPCIEDACHGPRCTLCSKDKGMKATL